MLTRLIIIRITKASSTSDKRLRRRSSTDKYLEMKKLPQTVIGTKYASSENVTAPISNAWMVLLRATTHIQKDTVDDVCNGSSPNSRIIGIRNKPPPSPNPLKIPPQKLYFTISLDFYQKLIFLMVYLSCSRIIWSLLSHSVIVLMFSHPCTPTNTSRHISKTQYIPEHLFIPTMESNFQEPRSNWSTPNPTIRRINFLIIQRFSQSLKGLNLFTSWSESLCWTPLLASFAVVSLSYEIRNLLYIEGRDVAAVIKIKKQTTRLGKNLLMITPNRLPINIKGIITNAQRNLIVVLPLIEVVAWLITFPRLPPSIRAYTSRVLRLGLQLQTTSRMATIGPPPPSPAMVETPEMRAIEMIPMISGRLNYKRVWMHQPSTQLYMLGQGLFSPHY